MNAVIVLVAGLGAAGVLPALAVARRSPVVIFLAPLTGAVMAAGAALIELGIGGSLLVNYAFIAVIVNVAVIVWWLRAGYSVKPSDYWPWGWSIGTAVFMLGCLAIPLSALRAPLIGWDGNSIWLTHTLMAYGGHHVYLAGLQNVAYQFSNPDYPPLIPAAGALAFRFFGLGDLHLATDMTTLLNACALGIVGTGIATAVSRGRAPARTAAVAAAGAICIVGFAVSGGYAFAGYADLLWAAAAVGAVIWGLVLPQATQALCVAWICAMAASLTKNEGLTTALILLVLISLRYRPLTMPGRQLRRWTERAMFVIVPALPGVGWAGLIHLLGIHDRFFKAASPESVVTRAHATIVGIAGYLAVAPVAFAVLVAGWVFLRGDRERAGIGNPLWLWGSCLAYLAVLITTYVYGGLEIHVWLTFSVNRTTVFAQVVLYAELATWLVIAADGAFSRTGSEPLASEGLISETLHGRQVPRPGLSLGLARRTSNSRMAAGIQARGRGAPGIRHPERHPGRHQRPHPALQLWQGRGHRQQDD